MEKGQRDAREKTRKGGQQGRKNRENKWIWCMPFDHFASVY